MLENKFKSLCQKFSKNEKLISQFWEEIKKQHSKDDRYYHTLIHLEHIYKELPQLNFVTEFAIFYHDIIYNISRNDNEKQSAILCSKRLKMLNVPSELIKNVTQLINETKTHIASSKKNTLFLNADLAILGSSTSDYKCYIQNIRKEYAIYDDATYFSGRQKVLKMFLNKEKIYESKHFYELYEKQARKNLEHEIKNLYSL